MKKVFLLAAFAILTHTFSCTKQDHYTTGFIEKVERVRIEGREMEVWKIWWREPIAIETMVGEVSTFPYWYVVPDTNITLEKFVQKSVSIRYRLIEYVGVPFKEVPLVYLIEITD